jgi:hypothetical protein
MRRARLSLLPLLFVVMAPAQHGGGSMAGGRVLGGFPSANAAGARGNPSSGLGGRVLPCFSWQTCRGAPPFWPNRFASSVYPPVVLYGTGWPAFNGAEYFGGTDPFYPGEPYPTNYTPPTYSAAPAPVSQDVVPIPIAPTDPGSIANNGREEIRGRCRVSRNSSWQLPVLSGSHASA